MRDSVNNNLLKTAIPPQSVGNNTPLVSVIVDTALGQELMLGILIGSLAAAAATFAVTFAHGDAVDNEAAPTAITDSAAVTEADLLSQTKDVAALTAAGFNQAADNGVRKIGYTGDKRWLRATITPAGNDAAALIAAFWEFRRLPNVPVVQPAA